MCSLRMFVRLPWYIVRSSGASPPLKAGHRHGPPSHPFTQQVQSPSKRFSLGAGLAWPGQRVILPTEPSCNANKVIRERKVLEVHIEKGMQHGPFFL